VGNFAHADPCQDRPKFYRNKGGSPDWTFEDKSASVGLPWVESHASPALGDIDNDGDLDMFITAVGGDYVGQKGTLMRNDGSWSFTDISAAAGIDFSATHTNFMAAWADFDDDGDLDLFTGRKLFMNELSNGNGWLKVILEGDGQEINADAIGAQVRITVAGLGTLMRQVENATGWGNQNDMTLHFGLGTAAGPVDLDITWPDGVTETLYGVSIDQTIAIKRCRVNLEDFAGLAAGWLDSPCYAIGYWCDGADIDKSGGVDVEDMKELADNWLTTLCSSGWDL